MKNFKTYRPLLLKCFKNAVLGLQKIVLCECFFRHQTETCLFEKLLSQKGLGLSCRTMLLSTSSELRFIKLVRYFKQNCISKRVIFWLVFVGFETFCEKIWNWKKKKTLMISTGTCGRKWKSCIPEIIFSKKQFQIWDFESSIFWCKFRFLGDCFRAF